jgi:hypothetical protein
MSGCQVRSSGGHSTGQVTFSHECPATLNEPEPPFCAEGRPSLEQPPGLPNWAIGALVRARVRFDPMLLGLGGVSAWIGVVMVARFRQRFGVHDSEVVGYMPGP